MTLVRQGLSYLVVGGILLVADWATFVLLTAFGAPAAPANLVGRVVGALLGYWLNGRFTFAVDGRTRLGRQHFGRFVLAWVALTLVSTVLVAAVATHVGLTYAWLAKPVVEAGLAVVGFLISRHWIYR